MKELFGQVIRWFDAWKNRGAGLRGLGFSLEELEANRRGLLLSSQDPPMFWDSVGLLLVLLVVYGCVRWVWHHRSNPGRYLIAVLALVCAVPGGYFIGELSSALRDRIEGRACALTNVSGGTYGSAWGLGRYYVRIGPEELRSSRGNAGRASLPLNEPFTAYYACHSGSFASVEPAPAGWSRSALGRQSDFERLLDFDAADLQANRAGRLHFHQLPLVALGCVVFFVLFFGVVAVGGLWEGVQKGSAVSLLLGLAFAAASLGLAFGHGLPADAVFRESCTAAGTLRGFDTRRVSKSTYTYWKLTLDGVTREFPGLSVGSALLSVGSRYSVHYACKSKNLLSIEPLS
jgi:hypothetical protein